MLFLSVLLLLLFTTDKTEATKANLCLTEDCIMAAATILGSLDEAVNPCDNFYQFACGGWMQKAIREPADRFEAVDKLNQNLVLKILESDTYEPSHSSIPSTATGKARAFYQSCMVNQDKHQGSMHDLAAIIMYTGGWNVADKLMASNEIISFDKRMQILQNELAVNVFFRHGLYRHDGRKRLAIVAGGWNKGLAEITSKSLFEQSMNTNVNFKQQYLQMMVGIVMELWKISYVEHQISQADVDNTQTTDGTQSNNNLTDNMYNDIDYQYGDMFNPNIPDYPYPHNSTVMADYITLSYDQNNIAESSEDILAQDVQYSNVTYPNDGQDPSTLGGLANQLLQWISVPFKWMSTISTCVNGDSSTSGYV